MEGRRGRPMAAAWRKPESRRNGASRAQLPPSGLNIALVGGVAADRHLNREARVRAVGLARADDAHLFVPGVVAGADLANPAGGVPVQDVVLIARQRAALGEVLPVDAA